MGERTLREGSVGAGPVEMPEPATPIVHRPRGGVSQHPAHPVGFLQAVQSLLTVLVVALFLMTFTVQPIRIPSASMEPTLLIGDFLLLDKQASGAGSPWWMPPSGVARGDVVVFHDPVDDPSIHLIKRVEGVPGDRIHLHGGRLFRNGTLVQENSAIYRAGAAEPYRDEFPDLRVMDPRVNPRWWIALQRLTRDGEITVPDGSFFVLGDNRNNSEDSRYWGFVPRDAIVGKPVLIYFSWREQELESGRGQGGEERREAVPETGEVRTADAGLVRASPTRFARWDRVFRRVR